MLSFARNVEQKITESRCTWVCLHSLSTGDPCSSARVPLNSLDGRDLGPQRVCGSCQSELAHAAAPRRQASSNDTDRLGRAPKSGKSRRQGRDRESGKERMHHVEEAVVGATGQQSVDPRNELGRPEPEPEEQSKEASTTPAPPPREQAQPERANDMMQLEYRGTPRNPHGSGAEDIVVRMDGSVRRVKPSTSGTYALEAICPVAFVCANDFTIIWPCNNIGR